jgi:hypothetical protein
MHRFRSGHAYESLRDAALVANYDDAESGPVEQSNCRSHIREKVPFFAGGDILTFRVLAVDSPSRSRETALFIK